MKILRYFVVSVVAAFLFLLATSVYFWFYLNPVPVDKQLFVNGVIITMDDDDTITDAVLVERGRIVATGTDKPLELLSKIGLSEDNDRLPASQP